jgi:hypothetical protein
VRVPLACEARASIARRSRTVSMCCDEHAVKDKVNSRRVESSCVLVKLCYVEIRRLDRSRVRKLIERRFAVRAGLLALGLDLWLGRT